jgi:hypothetical protein
MSLCTKEARYLDPGDTEVRVAARYVELLEDCGVKATLYVTGKCFTQEAAALRPVATSALVEVGGHSYWARQPRKLFDWYGRRTGNWNGPRWFQAWDIRKNIAVCEAMTGYRPVSWRAHSYKIDPNTYPLLAQYGVRCVSDAIEPRRLRPYITCRSWFGGGAGGEGPIISHPLNVIPDHDHLYHAHRTPEFVAAANARGYGADEFGAVSYHIGEWVDLVIAQAEAIEAEGGLVTILAHPICMWIADRFVSFRRLLEFVAGREHVWAREIPTLAV